VLVLPLDPSRPPTPPTGAYVRVHVGEATAGSPVALPSPEPPKRAIATVEVRTGGRLIATRTFDGATLRVGRGRDNQLVLADDRVSRHHGQLAARRGVLVYADLDSTNGSFVNGTRVHEIVLGSGDVVRLGNSTLTILSQS
jgi:pSer/pThr/pTyr-binding forkhead associated (FHA) protein